MEDTAPAEALLVERELGEFDTMEVSERRVHNPWIVLTSTSLAVFAVFLDTTIGFVSFPAISKTFSSAGPSTVSWVLNAYTLVFAALLIPSGRLADRVGRRRMFLIGVVVFTVGSMLCGLAPTVGVLIGAEMVEAAGAAILVPASLALVLQTFPREKVPVAVAIWGAIGAAAGAFGPTLGALVVSNLSWRWAFFINLPVGVFSFFLGRAVLPEGKEANPGRIPDPISVAVLALGIGLVVYAIVETQSTGWTSGQFWGVLIAGLVLLALFVDRCRRVPNPLIHLGLFRSRNFRWANAATIVYATAFSAMFLGNVLFLTRVWGYSILRAGLAISVGPLIVAVTAPFFGRLAGRIGQRALLIPGGLIWAMGGALLLARATTTPAYLTVYLPANSFTALGVALVLPQLSSVAVQGLPVDQFGAGSAVVQSLRYIGSTLGVALAIAFLDAQVDGPLDGFHHVWWMLVVLGIGVSLLSSRLARRPAAVVAPAAGHVPVLVADHG
jgi:EmrB/QacA subfamily drug resistance transporter